jgi:hypothetical protein
MLSIVYRCEKAGVLSRAAQHCFLEKMNSPDRRRLKADTYQAQPDENEDEIHPRSTTGGPPDGFRVTLALVADRDTERERIHLKNPSPGTSRIKTLLRRRDLHLFSKSSDTPIPIDYDLLSLCLLPRWPVRLT